MACQKAFATLYGSSVNAISPGYGSEPHWQQRWTELMRRIYFQGRRTLTGRRLRSTFYRSGLTTQQLDQIAQLILPVLAFTDGLLNFLPDNLP